MTERGGREPVRRGAGGAERKGWLLARVHNFRTVAEVRGAPSQRDDAGPLPRMGEQIPPLMRRRRGDSGYTVGGL